MDSKLPLIFKRTSPGNVLSARSALSVPQFSLAVAGVLILMSVQSNTVLAADHPGSGIVNIDGGATAIRSGSSAGGGGHSSTALGQPGPGSSDDTSTHEQARIYQRANENLTTQTLYIEENLKSLKDLQGRVTNSSSVNSDVQNAIVESTSNYCSPQVAQDRDGAIDCLTEYREMRMGQLQEIRKQLVDNGDTIARLHSDVSNGKGKSPSSGVPVYQANIKSRVYPKIPTYVELSAQFSKDAMKAYVPDLQRYQDALKFVKKVMREPKREDFAKTTEALVDPQNPDAGTFRKIVVGPDGKNQVDEEAFQTAHSAWAAMQKLKKSKLDVDSIAKRIVSAQKNANGNYATTLNEAVGSSLDDKTPQSCNAPGMSGTRRDYCMARNIVVMYFNGDAPSQASQPKQGSAVLTTPVADRSVSSQKGNGANTEGYVLKAEKPPKEGEKVKDESLYMDPSRIDEVIDSQSKP